MNSECTVCRSLLSSEPGVGVTTWRADYTRFECTWFIAKSYQRSEDHELVVGRTGDRLAKLCQFLACRTVVLPQTLLIEFDGHIGVVQEGLNIEKLSYAATCYVSVDPNTSC
jgi:hypothetical protein